MREYGSYDWVAPPPEVLASVKQQFRAIGRTPPQPSLLNRWLSSIMAPRPALVISGAVAFLAIVVLGYTLITLLSQRPSLAATLSDIRGSIEVQSSGDREWRPVADGYALQAGDRVRLDGEGRGVLRFPDGSTAELSPNAQLSILQLVRPEDGEGQIAVLHQYFGKTEYSIEPQVDDDSWFEIETSSATITVKGTEFAVEITERLETLVSVREGTVEVMGEGTSIEIVQGQSAYVLPRAEPKMGIPDPDSAPPCPLEDDNADPGSCYDDGNAIEESPEFALESSDLEDQDSGYSETIYLPGINTGSESSSENAESESANQE